jgi:hypothetical protein
MQTQSLSCTLADLQFHSHVHASSILRPFVRPRLLQPSEPFALVPFRTPPTPSQSLGNLHQLTLHLLEHPSGVAQSRRSSSVVKGVGDSGRRGKRSVERRGDSGGREEDESRRNRRYGRECEKKRGKAVEEVGWAVGCENAGATKVVEGGCGLRTEVEEWRGG